MVPKRMEELLDGGSLYWVIKGQVQARQKLLDIETFTDGDGIGRCHLILGPEVDRNGRPADAAPSRAGAIIRKKTCRATSTSLGGGIAEMPADFAELASFSEA